MTIACWIHFEYHQILLSWVTGHHNKHQLQHVTYLTMKVIQLPRHKYSWYHTINIVKRCSLSLDINDMAWNRMLVIHFLAFLVTLLSDVSHGLQDVVPLKKLFWRLKASEKVFGRVNVLLWYYCSKGQKKTVQTPMTVRVWQLVDDT